MVPDSISVTPSSESHGEVYIAIVAIVAGFTF
jgi:hypothetical protein